MTSAKTKWLPGKNTALRLNSIIHESKRSKKEFLYYESHILSECQFAYGPCVHHDSVRYFGAIPSDYRSGNLFLDRRRRKYRQSRQSRGRTEKRSGIVPYRNLRQFQEALC